MSHKIDAGLVNDVIGGSPLTKIIRCFTGISSKQKKSNAGLESGMTQSKVI